MYCTQQTICCSDFAVRLRDDQTPTFRVLLPEHLTADSFEFPGTIHTIPGRWEGTPESVHGEFTVGDGVEIGVSLESSGDDEILAELKVRNLLTQPLENVQTNVCVSFNTLPSPDGFPWANRMIIPPSIPLDRDLQGRWWYKHLTPANLMKLTRGEWVLMHERPNDPDPDSVDRYRRVINPSADTRACAVKAPGHDFFVYESWSVPCRSQAPFWGNACMHLQPLVSESLDPDSTSVLHARIGVYEGDWRGLAAYLEK